MKLFLILFLLTSKIYACPKLVGTWKQCSLSTEMLNPVELLAVNVGLKSLRFIFKNPYPDVFQTKVIKTNFFSAPDILLDETSIIGKNNYTKWDRNILEGSTPPEFVTYYKCTNSGMVEYIEWDNLSVENYPDHATSNFPAFYKSKYTVTGNRISRKVYSRRSTNENFSLIASLTCHKN